MFSTCCCAVRVVPPLWMPVGARGTIPLNLHAQGEAHTPEVSEAAAHGDAGGDRDPYCWKHNANTTPFQDHPLQPGRA